MCLFLPYSRNFGPKVPYSRNFPGDTPPPPPPSPARTDTNTSPSARRPYTLTQKTHTLENGSVGALEDELTGSFLKGSARSHIPIRSLLQQQAVSLTLWFLPTSRLTSSRPYLNRLRRGERSPDPVTNVCLVLPGGCPR